MPRLPEEWGAGKVLLTIVALAICAALATAGSDYLRRSLALSWIGCTREQVSAKYGVPSKVYFCDSARILIFTKRWISESENYGTEAHSSTRWFAIDSTDTVIDAGLNAVSAKWADCLKHQSDSLTLPRSSAP